MRGRRVRPATHPQERRSPEVRRVSLADRRRIRGGNTPAGPQEVRNRDAAHPTIRSVLARPRYASRRHSIAEVAVSRSWQLSWWISRCRTSLRKAGKQVVYTCLEFRERPHFTESIRVWIQSSPLRGGCICSGWPQIARDLPGWKADFSDCRRLQYLHSLGWLRAQLPAARMPIFCCGNFVESRRHVADHWLEPHLSGPILCSDSPLGNNENRMADVSVIPHRIVSSIVCCLSREIELKP